MAWCPDHARVDPSAAAQLPESPGNRSNRMKRSIATVSLSGTLPEKLEAAAAAGFDGVELFENDLLYHSGSPQDIRRLCEALGIAVTPFHPFRDFAVCPRARVPQHGK